MGGENKTDDDVKILEIRTLDHIKVTYLLGESAIGRRVLLLPTNEERSHWYLLVAFDFGTQRQFDQPYQ